MNFLITSYTYPLSAPIQLSSRFNYYFDNPRTEEEIEIVSLYLESYYQSGYDVTLPVHSETLFSLEQVLLVFRENFVTRDDYVEHVFENYQQENFFRFLASIWVVIRFDDGLQKASPEEMPSTTPFRGMHPIIYYESHSSNEANEKLTNYTYLLSLLGHTESHSYFGRGIILNPDKYSRKMPANNVWMDFIMFGSSSQSFPEIEDETLWKFFPTAHPMLSECAGRLDTILENNTMDKFLYIGSILKVVRNEVHDKRIRIVMLTSILELLLTHNPDHSRFNVEDSINKQFQLKTSILVYLNDKSKDINVIKNKLKRIYQQRSNIAHGNFNEFTKFERSLSKKDGKEEYVDDLIVDLYEFIRAVVEEFIQDRVFVEFLKQA